VAFVFQPPQNYRLLPEPDFPLRFLFSQPPVPPPRHLFV
jgi:hypothetical protein